MNAIEKEARQLGQETRDCVSRDPDLFREAERTFDEDYSWQALSSAERQVPQPLPKGFRYTRKSPNDNKLYFRLRKAIDDILRRTPEVGGLGESWFEDPETPESMARFVVWIARFTLDGESELEGATFKDDRGVPRSFLLAFLSENEQRQFFAATREALSLVSTHIEEDVQSPDKPVLGG